MLFNILCQLFVKLTQHSCGVLLLLEKCLARDNGVVFQRGLGKHAQVIFWLYRITCCSAVLAEHNGCVAPALCGHLNAAHCAHRPDKREQGALVHFVVDFRRLSDGEGQPRRAGAMESTGSAAKTTTTARGHCKSCRNKQCSKDSCSQQQQEQQRQHKKSQAAPHTTINSLCRAVLVVAAQSRLQKHAHTTHRHL